MTSEKHNEIRGMLLELADYVGVKGVRGLAGYLGLDANVLYSWTSRGAIADTGAIVRKIPEVRVEWLLFGEGDMLFQGANGLGLTQIERLILQTISQLSEIEQVELISRLKSEIKS